jgi:nucleoside-diphosphate-sugar epimerase
MVMDETDLASLTPELRAAIGEERARFQRRNGEPAERRVLIVGGAGYIGGSLTQHLLAHGARVRNLDSLLYHHGAAILGFLSHPRYEFIHGDMGSRRAVELALKGVTDVVILAGMVGDPITKSFPTEADKINDASVRTCIDAMDGRGLNKVIFVSTCSNYGILGQGEVATEDFELRPISLYAKSKVAAEQYLLSHKCCVDYSPTILRFATAFGLAPRVRFDLTVNEFTRELFLNNELLVFDAHTWRPYCHVSDFARLIARVLEYPVADVRSQVFNAGGDINNHTKQNIVDLILERLPNRRVTYRGKGDDLRNYRVSFEKVRTRLHFTPRVTVAGGIDEIIWALSAHMLDDVAERPDYFGNYALPGLQSWKWSGEDHARAGARSQLGEQGCRSPGPRPIQ